MTISQAGSSLGITLNSGRLSATDSTWSGSIDAAGRVTATWQPPVGDNTLFFFCDNNREQRVVLRSATASLSYQPGAAVIEGTITSRYDVSELRLSDFRIVMVGELSETTNEHLSRQ